MNFWIWEVHSRCSRLTSQEIGWEDRRLRNDLFCVEWDVQVTALTQASFRSNLFTI